MSKGTEQEAVAQVVTYLALLLQHHGGSATIPIEEIEAGLPAGHGVHMEQDDAGNLTMEIRSKNEQKEEESA